MEASRPGELLNQDTFYWGTLKGVGKVYVQVVVDVFCSLAFAKVYTAKMPVTAADLLYDRVLPFYEALGVKVGAILTDNGREFCGIQERHPYELLLAMEDIEHRTTKIRSPRTNGFVERMNRTLLDECFRVQGRQTWYIGVEEIQRDLDRFMRYYNLERSHQGYRLKGRTPAQALMEALGSHRDPRHHPCRGGQRAAANGCLTASPEIRTVGEIRDLYTPSSSTFTARTELLFSLIRPPHSQPCRTIVTVVPVQERRSLVNVFGPLSINRSVSQNTNGSWKYTITKPIGGAASFDPLP